MRKALTRVASLLAAATGVMTDTAAAEPPVPVLEFAFEAKVQLGQPVKAGETAIGGRNIVPILGGTVAGPAIRGIVMPGGWDWQLERRDGCVGIKSDYMLKTDDGVVINILDTGVVCPATSSYAAPPRTMPVFEVPRGQYDWLGRSAFVGVAEPFTGPTGSGLKIRFYRVK